MKRREFLRNVCAGAAAMAAADSGAAGQRPLNVMLVLADDLGWADLACYGAELHETPNLDRLAREGMRFTQAYAAAPVCSPTRASIHTGKAPARLHMTIWREATQNPPKNRKLIPPINEPDLPQQDTSLAEVFHKAGYLTAHVGKWHLGDAANYPEVHGFDVNIGGSLWGAPSTFFYPYRGTGYGEYRYVPHTELGQEGEYLTDRLASEAIKIMEQANGRPFFLNMAFHSVHKPIEGKPELVAHYEKKLRPGMKHQNPAYAAMVHSLDENVGRLLKKLEELGVAENTLVVFTSDNGGVVSSKPEDAVTNNAPLRSGKGSLYEGGIRVPLIVRWPGKTVPGGESQDEVISTDLYPTLLAAAGLEGSATQNAGLDGRSFTPLLDGSRDHLEPRTLCFHYPHYYPTTTPVSAVRQGDWKLLEYFEDGHTELYNLAEDLGEAEDLSARYPEKTKELMASLRAWRKDVNAQMPEANPDFRGK